MNQRQRLLVVDDSADTRATLSGYLDRIGYRARFASSGEQALAMLRDGLQTDAVVYDDATRPAMGGGAFVRQLRSDGKLTPVLLMTKPFQLLDFGDRLLRMWADQARTVSAPGSAASTAESR
jgi:CheY-like chemotaxis protein